MKENRQFTPEISFGKERADMAEWKKLPIGLENFREVQKSGFYYVDKTKLIEQLLENWSKVNLFTRPRRFGKTLNSLRVFLKLEQIERCLMVSIFPGTKSCVRNIWENTLLSSCHSKELTAYLLRPQNTV